MCLNLRYVELLDISAEDLAALKADADGFRYALQTLGDMQAYARHQVRDSASSIQATYCWFQLSCRSRLFLVIRRVDVGDSLEIYLALPGRGLFAG
jgi:hypothetical protein